MESGRCPDWLGPNSIVKDKPVSGADEDMNAESDWFLQHLGDPVRANEPALNHCALCERIVLSERFHVHVCEISTCDKQPCKLSQPQTHPAKSMATQQRANRRKASGWENIGMEPEATRPIASQRIGSKKKSTRKKGTGAGNKRKSTDVLGDVDLKGKLGKFFRFSNWDAHPGHKMKTRKLADVLKNGPKSIPCHLVSCVGINAAWRCRELPLMGDGSDAFCGGQSVDWWGDGLKLPLDDGARVENLTKQNWCNEWGQLSLAGELKFPSEVRKQRSTHPIRRSRYPSPSLTVEEGPDVLIDTSSLWYTVAFDPLSETLGSVTVLGCG